MRALPDSVDITQTYHTHSRVVLGQTHRLSEQLGQIVEPVESWSLRQVHVFLSQLISRKAAIDACRREIEEGFEARLTQYSRQQADVGIHRIQRTLAEITGQADGVDQMPVCLPGQTDIPRGRQHLMAGSPQVRNQVAADEASRTQDGESTHVRHPKNCSGLPALML